MAGHVLGGALELAMACHFRVAAEGSRFSMPEVNLGINPGAGGTQRLPRLVGLEPAMEMLLTGRPIDASGAANGVWSTPSVRRRSCWTPPRHVLAIAPRRFAQTRRSARKNRRSADPRRPHWPGPKRDRRRAAGTDRPGKILDAVRAGVEESFQAGLLAEQEAFRQCMATRATQNKIYVFCASRQTVNVPELQSVTAERITEAGVLGMGTMGSGDRPGP